MLKSTLMLIHPVRCGMAFGTTNAMMILVVGLLSAFTKFADEWVHLYASVYWGFSTTLVGIVIGVLWSFFTAFLLGLLFAHVFNFFVYLDQSDDYE